MQVYLDDVWEKDIAKDRGRGKRKILDGKGEEIRSMKCQGKQIITMVVEMDAQKDQTKVEQAGKRESQC